MPTLNQLARRIMLEQSVLRAGEQPSAAQAADINAVQRSIHAELLERHLIDWPLESIPVHCEQAWVEYMAGKCAAMFGVKFPETYAETRDAERRLIALSAQPIDPRDNEPTDY